MTFDGRLEPLAGPNTGVGFASFADTQPVSLDGSYGSGSASDGPPAAQTSEGAQTAIRCLEW